jgi:PAS domain S-box-containing protein
MAAGPLTTPPLDDALGLMLRERDLRRIVDATPALIAYVGADGRYRWVNQTYQAWFGISPQQARLRHMREALGEAAWRVIEPYVKQALDGHVVRYQRELPPRPNDDTRGGDGGKGPRWLCATYTPDRDEASGRVRGFVVHAMDVTESKCAEAALRASEAELQTIVDSMTQGLVVSDMSGKLLHWNRAALEMHAMAGLEEGRRPASEFSATFELATLDGAVLAFEAWPLSRLLRGEPVRDLELRVRRRDRPSGDAKPWERVFRYGGTLVRVARGEPMMAIVTVSDVTEQRRVDERLRLEGAALQATASGVVITDRQGTIQWVNHAFSEISGYSASEAVGQNPRILKSGKHGAAFYRQVWETICRGDPWHGVMINRRKDGTLYHEDLTISPVRDALGAITHFVAVKKDVTDRIKAARALRDSERRLRAVVQTAMDGIITADAAGTIESANPAVERLFGYRAGRLVGKNVSLLIPASERQTKSEGGSRQGHVCEYLRIGRGKAASGAVREVIGRRRDGTLFPLELAVNEVKLAGRRMFVGVMHDVTQRRQLEREVLHVSENEQARIGRDLHDDICQRLLAAALGLQVVETKLGNGAGRPEEAADVARIRELLEQTNAQTRDLARGLYPLQLARGGLQAALEEMAALVCAHAGAECDCRCDEGFRPADPAVAVHLYRIAQEAISNALRHGKAKRVEVRLARRRGRTHLSIADDGVGMGAAPPTAEVHGEGDGRSVHHGVGIQTMKYRARVIGATLDVRSRAEGGTVVSCSLPDGAPAPAETPKPLKRTRRHRNP